MVCGWKIADMSVLQRKSGPQKDVQESMGKAAPFLRSITRLGSLSCRVAAANRYVCSWNERVSWS